MKTTTRNPSSCRLLVFLVILLLTFLTISVEARKDNEGKSRPEKQRKQQGHHPGGQSCIFDVLSFGAKADGVSDDSKALLAAWAAACKVPGATVEIPSGHKFLIQPITLQGPCKPSLVLQIDGTLLAPPNLGSWPKSSLFHWINIKGVHNFMIRGAGTVDGQGFNWWTHSQASYIQKKSKSRKPTALKFDAGYNITVRDIKIVNSPQFHLKFDNSGGVRVNNIAISSPGSSPNTDGIHLQNTQDVVIQHSNIATGDDCVSIQTGCSNVHIHDINCGPGHGISIGGLGKDNSVACVSNIVVENIVMKNTTNGGRIKTWQGGRGSVKNVSFSNIQVEDVKVPIIIDQYYCDKSFCKNQTAAVAISGVTYDKIIGTYSGQPIHLACSKSVPCTDVGLIDIQLKPSPSCKGNQQALCVNSYGRSQAPLVPSSIDHCLRSGGGSVMKSIEKSYEKIC